MEPLDFGDLVKWNHSIFKFATVGTTRFKLIAPALNHRKYFLDLVNKGKFVTSKGLVVKGLSTYDVLFLRYLGWLKKLEIISCLM